MPLAPMPEPSDDMLMRAAGAGDRAAFGQLVLRHYDRFGRLAGRITGSRTDAEEVVQEAFLRAWVKAPAWRAREGNPEGASFATWFGRVLVNLCIDRTRRPKNEPLDAAEAMADPMPDGFEAAAGSELARRVAAAVDALPERQRAALLMCHYEGISNIEAASILEISVGALESLLIRARRNLREALADLAPERTKL